MLRPIAMFAAAGIIGVVLSKLLMVLVLPLVGMFIGFALMILKVLFIVGLVFFGYWLFNRMTGEKPAES